MQQKAVGGFVMPFDDAFEQYTSSIDGRGSDGTLGDVRKNSGPLVVRYEEGIAVTNGFRAMAT
jgi:hypothetical protein